MGSNTCETRVGRLLEIRVGAGYDTVADVDAMIAQIAREVAHIAPKKVVIAADWRPIKLMSAQAAGRALDMLTTGNPAIERSAILVSDRSPTAVMQFFRLVRESHNENRRLFSDPSDLAAWLDEVLAPEEAARLHVFLRG
jgi:hypothetical protein